jgi:hypothetical protein
MGERLKMVVNISSFILSELGKYVSSRSLATARHQRLAPVIIDAQEAEVWKIKV